MSNMTERIAKLLTLAEAAGTQEEAEAAFAKAQELATKFEIDLEIARQAAAPKEREVPIQRKVMVGEAGKHVNKPLINLYDAVAKSNSVRILIARNSTYVLAHGLPSDIDAVEAMWTSLAVTMTRLGDQLVRDKNAAWRSETTRMWDNREWRNVEKPVTGQGARRSFYDGFVGKIAARLSEARQEAIKVADAAHFHETEPVAAVEAGSDNLPSSMALVLKDKDQEVESFMWSNYEQKYGRRRPRGGWNGGSNATHSTSAHSAGRAAASRANLGGHSRKGIGA